MADQITNYQCPTCTGPLHFDGKSGKLVCDYCGSAFTVGEIEALYAKKDAAAAQAMQQEETKKQADAQADAAAASQDDSNSGWDLSDLDSDWGKDAEGLRSYTCPSCGAELICDDTTAATSCPYCGNPSIVPGQFTASYRPEFVLPFRLSKEDAIKALQTHYKGKLFLPGTFRSESHLQEMKGLYVPFWMYDGEADGWAKFEATRTHRRRSGDYEITETDHYDIYRKGVLVFSRIPVDASSKMPDDYMDSIEPFSFEELKPFSTAYLPGFLADKYDVDSEKSQARADKRCENTMTASLASTVKGYDTTSLKSKSITLKRGAVHYALLPVWTLHTKWNGKDFLFAMNGQTGKMVGDLPVSKRRFFALFGGIAGALSVISTLIALLAM